MSRKSVSQKGIFAMVICVLRQNASLNSLAMFFLCISLSYHGAHAAPFNKATDILIAQFDNNPDADDIHSQAALGCILVHPDGKDVKVYGVTGAYGSQGTGGYISSKTLFTMIFGPENTNWTDAHTDRANSVIRIRDKAKPILEAGGKVWVQEAGQSDITLLWINALIAAGVPAATVKNNVMVIQHSGWNESNTSSGVLDQVKQKATYVKIADGNDTADGNPGYKSAEKAYLLETQEQILPNAKAQSFWVEAVKIVTEARFGGSYSVIPKGGVDFSDCVENWYILELGDSAGTVRSFWDRYVVNVPEGANPLPKVKITTPANGTSMVPPASIVVTVEATDNGSITKVELRRNGILVETDATTPYSFSLNNLSEGAHLLEARAYDNQGATANSLITVPVWDPGKRTVYQEKGGMAIAEVEDLVYNHLWQFYNSKSGFTGKGYLKYVGLVNGEGDPKAHNIDVDCKYQGTPQDRLVMWVKINTTGTYYVLYHTLHITYDGDNDAWVGQMDKPCEATRFGTWGYDAGKFMWCGFGGVVGNNDSHFEAPLHPMNLEAGKTYGIYAMGRSSGYYLDRVALFLKSAETTARNLSTQISDTMIVTVGTIPSQKSIQQQKSFGCKPAAEGFMISGAPSVDVYNLKGIKIGSFQKFIKKGSLPEGLYIARGIQNGKVVQTMLSILK